MPLFNVLFVLPSLFLLYKVIRVLHFSYFPLLVNQRLPAAEVALCFVPIWMELPLEAYYLVVDYINNFESATRLSDLCALMLTSKKLKRAAERALYRDMRLDSPRKTILACRTLVENERRLGELVLSMTIHTSTQERASSLIQEDDEEDEEAERRGRNSNSVSNATITGDVTSSSIDAVGADVNYGIPETFWPAISFALQCLRRLQHLHVHIESGNSRCAWVLWERDLGEDTVNITDPIPSRFKLKTFYSDFTWDAHLVKFLSEQDQIQVLHLADYRPLATSQLRGDNEMDVSESDNVASGTTSYIALSQEALPALTILECPFIDAIVLLAPNRPITCVKTCFSHEDIFSKIDELEDLCNALSKISGSGLESLDLADASYEEGFSMVILESIVRVAPGLRYLGTLALPVGVEVCL